MKKASAAFTVFVLVYYPFAVLLFYDISSFVYGRGLDRENTKELSYVVRFLDENMASDDVVLSTSHISRLVRGRGAELYQGLAAEGITVSYYGRVLPSYRFFFNSSYRKAKYVVLHKDTLTWLAVNMSMRNVSSELSAWPVVYSTEYFRVYERPLGLQDVSAVEDNPCPEC